jgi:hypothetical protein
MLGYDYEIIYKKRKENVKTYELSRKEYDKALVYALYMLQLINGSNLSRMATRSSNPKINPIVTTIS